jgi:hypothetical protein
MAGGSFVLLAIPVAGVACGKLPGGLYPKMPVAFAYKMISARNFIISAY